MLNLVHRLRRDFGPGYSLPHLKNLRAFYLAYPRLLGALKGYAPRSLSEPVASPTDIALLISHTPCDDSWLPGLLHSNLS